MNPYTHVNSTTAAQRLKQDYIRMKRDPIPYICAEPLPSNILEWHYVLQGPDLTPYEGGYYHGKLIFPRDFPFKPPNIYMITPSGRFKCNTRLCLSITDFHSDTWNPAWSVSSILMGLLSFMVEKGPTLGSVQTSDLTKRQLAAQSWAFNLKDKIFCELFPELWKEITLKQQAYDQLEKKLQDIPKADLSSDESSVVDDNGHEVWHSYIPGGVLNHQGHHLGWFRRTLAKLFVIFGFMAFAYTVKYVLRSIV